MPQNEARAWWADAADARESIERRRAADAAPAKGPTPTDELAHVRARRAMAARERTGRFDREPAAAPVRDRRFERTPAPAPATAPERAPIQPASTALPEGAPRRPLVAPVPRRTVQITGHPGRRPDSPRLVEIDRRRAARRPAERVGPRPDRLAMWAVMLGLFLILVAATSSHAAMLAH